MSLIFKPEYHQYISNDGDNIDWTSVTSLLSKLKQDFNADQVALKCSRNKKSKWYGLTPTEIKDIWNKESKRATDLGTWYHNQREDDLCEINTLVQEGVTLPIIQPIIIDGVKQAPSQKLSEGIYPEHLTFLKSAGICGQADVVEVIDGRVNIRDFKTNKEINSTSFVNWEGIPQMMKSPVAHLQDCNLTHYNLQLSIYMYMILKHNPKLRAGSITVEHILFKKAGEDKYGYPITERDNDGNPILEKIVYYELPYMKNEVISIMNWFKNHKQTAVTQLT